MGIIIAEIVTFYEEIVKNFEKILEEFKIIFQDVKNIWRNFRTIIFKIIGKILKKCEYRTNFGKTRRNFFRFFNKFRKIFQMWEKFWKILNKNNEELLVEFPDNFGKISVNFQRILLKTSQATFFHPHCPPDSVLRASYFSHQWHFIKCFANF